MPEDISEIREQKKKELQEQIQEGRKEKQEQVQKQAEAMKQQMLRQALTKEARERLGRIRAATPEKAEKVEALAIRLWRSGQINGKITDEKLKQLLKKISSQKKEPNIKRR